MTDKNIRCTDVNMVCVIYEREGEREREREIRQFILTMQIDRKGQHLFSRQIGGKTAEMLTINIYMCIKYSNIFVNVL